MIQLWYYDGAFCQPDAAAPFNDVDAEWKDALKDPQVLPPSEKNRSVAVCAAAFAEGARSKEQTAGNLLRSHGLVLDVDCWREDRPPFTYSDLVQRLAPFRFIAWTTFSSTAALRRWRVVLPLASPMAPTKHRALWRMVNEILDNTMAEGTSDPGRLGYLGSVASEGALEAYEWHIHAGPRLDWSQLEGLEEEPLTGYRKALQPPDLTQDPAWAPRQEALEGARRYFRRVGVDTQVGGRHEALLKASCALWWDWAAPDEAFVRDVLDRVNSNFPEPKSEDEVLAEVRAGYERTLGHGRVEQSADYGHKRAPESRATLDGIADFGRQLRRRGHESLRQVGRTLLAMAAREAYCDRDGDPKYTTMRAVEQLAELYPREPPDKLLKLLQPALDAQRSRTADKPPPSDQEVLSRLRHTQLTLKKRSEEREGSRNDVQRRNIRAAFNGKRDTPYTPHEYREWEQQGFVDDQWILQSGRSYYFRVGTDYVGPFCREEALVAAARYLSPAEDRVKLVFIDAKGNRKKRTIEDLMDAHGSVLHKVQHSLTASRSEFNEETRFLTKAVAPLRPLQPERNTQVEEWLSLLAGDKYDLLCGWLAGATYLDRASVAIYFCGPAGIGKNLFAHGVSRLWTETGPSKLETYTETLERCPLIFCDERLPSGWRQGFSTRLRALVSENSRDVKKPYVNHYSVVGYPRVILAANGYEMVGGTGETIRSRDAQALKERMLMIETEDARKAGDDAPTTKFLKSLGPRHRDFVDEDILARHALWLRDSWTFTKDHRFLVEDRGDQFANTFSVQNEQRSRVLEWIYSYLAAGSFGAGNVVLAKGDTIYVNSPGLARNWELYDTARRGIKEREITTAVSGLSKGRIRAKMDADSSGKVAWYRMLNMQMFWTWVDQVDGEADLIRENLAALAQKRPFSVEQTQDDGAEAA